jgi:hypothetical protein
MVGLFYEITKLGVFRVSQNTKKTSCAGNPAYFNFKYCSFSRLSLLLFAILFFAVILATTFSSLLSSSFQVVFRRTQLTEGS